MVLRASSSPSTTIRAGDVVIVYERHDAMRSVVVEPGKRLGTPFGEFELGGWVGQEWGSRAVHPKGGWVTLLRPTPELWTLVLRHRTQILYVADISMVCSMLELRPGSRVLESGTGSGSLTTALARAVNDAGRPAAAGAQAPPTGHVFTFEFHEERAGAAREDFERNGLGEVITVEHRDVERDGFPYERLGEGTLDGAVLDLPGPWRAIPSAAKALRPDGRIAVFSPCVEQVQKACASLASCGFHDVRPMEILLRSYELWPYSLTGYAGKGGEGARGGKGVGPPAASPAAPAATVEVPEAAAAAVELPEAARPAKRARSEGEDAEPSGPRSPTEGDGAGGAEGRPAPDTPASPDPLPPSQRICYVRPDVLAKPVSSGRGHTGYLVFARKAIAVGSGARARAERRADAGTSSPPSAADVVAALREVEASAIEVAAEEEANDGGTGAEKEASDGGTGAGKEASDGGEAAEGA